MRGVWIAAMLTCIALQPARVVAKDSAQTSPEAGSRTYLQNFKDMVLAECLATAYKPESGASNDIGSSISALRDWTYYDMERAPDAIHALVAKYLARDYRNPVVEPDVRNLSAFLWARRLNNALSTSLHKSLTEQDSKLVHC
ncbi:type VI secretion system amidase immunity protein Tai4 [Burkholderia dolosa]|uniref:type VI secretion system amidase immunity protein Tai4 n=1 Tax=Burkholderia dolosa TaxID=152500 RepID=UPI0027D20982|nr:type VI secretion system amidase immunity protein Tai4 [Burkholderia dolosa]